MPIFSFNKYNQIIPGVAIPIYTQHACMHVTCSSLLNLAKKKKRHLILNHVWLITCEVKYLFICQLIIWISSSVIYLFINFSFLFHLLSFCWQSIFILDINPISFMHWKYFLPISFLKEYETLSFRVLHKNISLNYFLQS